MNGQLTLWNFKSAIGNGKAVIRRSPHGEAIVWALDDWYYVQQVGSEPDVMPCPTWASVLDDLGSWSDLPGWQFYTHELPVLQGQEVRNA